MYYELLSLQKIQTFLYFSNPLHSLLCGLSIYEGWEDQTFPVMTSKYFCRRSSRFSLHNVKEIDFISIRKPSQMNHNWPFDCLFPIQLHHVSLKSLQEVCDRCCGVITSYNGCNWKRCPLERIAHN